MAIAGTAGSITDLAGSHAGLWQFCPSAYTNPDYAADQHSRGGICNGYPSPRFGPDTYTVGCTCRNAD